jgi:hypothetical protein
MAAPTIVLVHGAFADASGFRGLYDELLGEDVTVVAPPNPLRGLTGGDGEYIKAAPSPAWRSRPSWAVFGSADRCIDPGVHRFSYQRMGATVSQQVLATSAHLAPDSRALGLAFAAFESMASGNYDRSGNRVPA